MEFFSAEWLGKPLWMWKGFVAVVLVLLAFATSMAGAFVGAAVMGLGFGMYQAVDFALITQVLPDAEGRGRDLGILNIAAALPQVAAPAFAVALIKGIDASYSTLYLVAAVVSVLGSLLVLRKPRDRGRRIRLALRAACGS